MSIQIVAVIADDHVLPFELSLASRVLSTARDQKGHGAYDVRICTVGGRAVSTTAGFTLAPAEGLSILGRADMVVIAPSMHHTGLRPGTLPAPIRQALSEVPRAARLVSVCMGSFVLASAGLLDGLTATTHWAWAEQLSQAFPAVRVDANSLFVAQDRIVTSAGAAAGIDMFLHIVREDHGSAIANDVARRCIVPAWRDGGQQQYIPQPVPAHDTDHIGATLDWATTMLAAPLGIDDLARHATMSRRTFTRKFREATGTSPGNWLLRQRLEQAKRLLETTDKTVDDIAHTCGFGSSSALRKHLRACTGVSPAAYRKAFHA